MYKLLAIRWLMITSLCVKESIWVVTVVRFVDFKSLMTGKKLMPKLIIVFTNCNS